MEPVLTIMCQNCDQPDTELTAVHRVYVVAAAWDAPASNKQLSEVELWCFSCRTHYPHADVSPD